MKRLKNKGKESFFVEWSYSTKILYIKMKEYLKSEIKHIPLILILFILFYGITTLATTTLFNSSEVKYNNTTSGIQSDKVQGAIDELYACASNYGAYNTRLTNAETTIGTGSLNTTAQNLIGGVNELNGKIKSHISMNRLGSKPSDGIMTHSSIAGYDIIVVALVDQNSGAIHGMSFIDLNTYKATTALAALGTSGYNNGRIYAYINYKTNTTSNVQVCSGYAAYLYGLKLA